MGRRTRRRNADPSAAPAVADHQARVRVSDDVWRDFKAASDGSVSRALGALVEEEVDRYRARKVASGEASERELLDALTRAVELEKRVASLVQRLDGLRSSTGPQ